MAYHSSILSSVRSKTRVLLDSGNLDHKGIDAHTLSVDLNLDRANVSRILNRLWKEGLLIKFQGKPTLFLDRGLIRDCYPGFFIPQTVAKGESLSQLIRQEEPVCQDKNSFDQLIGAEGSLREAIETAKAAISYPPFGLNLLLTGPSGCGQRLFVSCLRQYRQTLSQTAVPLVHFSCRSYAASQKGFFQQFLGTPKDTDGFRARRGLLDSAKGGILFFQDLDALGEPALSLVLSTLTSGSYSRLGETAQRPIQCMVVASWSSSAPPLGPMGQSAFPSVLTLPSFCSMNLQERLALVLKDFCSEAVRLNLPLRVSKDVLVCLSCLEQQESISQVSAMVRSASSKAYLEARELRRETVYVHLHHLAEFLLSTHPSPESREYIRNFLAEIPNPYIDVDRSGRTKHPLPGAAASFPAPAAKLPCSLESGSIDSIYQNVVDSISALAGCRESDLLAIRKTIYPIVFQIVIAQLKRSGKYENGQKQLHLLYGALLHLTSLIRRGGSSPSSAKHEAPAASADSFPEEYQIAMNILNSLASIYSCRFSSREVDYLASYLAIFSNWTSTVNMGLLVICHGDSTASDLVASAMNTLYGDYIIDYINFNRSMSLKTCLETAAQKADTLNRGSGILILTDMEPLTTINEYITRRTGIDATMIYPVTLPLLLETIRQVLENRLDLSALPKIGHTQAAQSPALSSQDSFIKSLAEKVISKTTAFLDIQKAMHVLEKCLRATLYELHLPYSNEIAARYLCHCCNMLERTIRKDTWSYSKLNSFTNEHSELMRIVEQKLEYAENIFGIKIPASEIAYIAEIFL